jgi:hypothetical protein
MQKIHNKILFPPKNFFFSLFNCKIFFRKLFFKELNEKKIFVQKKIQKLSHCLTETEKNFFEEFSEVMNSNNESKRISIKENKKNFLLLFVTQKDIKHKKVNKFLSFF